jgi:4-aminobutyrate aminotransferase/(S)-3-amino-2-methylpropionate transaminase
VAPSLIELPPAADAARGDELPSIAVTPPGPRTRAALARLEAVENPAFARRRASRRDAAGGEDMAPIVLARGRGSNVWDADENRYVDLAAGFGALALGHGASAIARATGAQAERLVQGLGDLYASEVKLELLERLARLHPGTSPRVMLAATGADAVTAALKTVQLATGRPGVVAFEGAYHGLGYAPLAACGFKESYRAPFAAQLNPHVWFAPYPRVEGDLDRALSAVDAALATGAVGAVLVEPILGRGGCVVPPRGFLAALHERARARGALLIADEIWTGLGRAGRLVRSLDEVEPDVLVLGKALGGGHPIAACVAPEGVAAAWARADEVVHTSTHAGWPLGCAAAIATLDAIHEQRLDRRSREVGARFATSLRAALAGAPGVRDVRGEGLFLGVELASGALGLRALRAWLERGYVATTGGAAHEVLVATPPLTIAEAQLEAAAGALREALDGLAGR